MKEIVYNKSSLESYLMGKILVCVPSIHPKYWCIPNFASNTPTFCLISFSFQGKWKYFVKNGRNIDIHYRHKQVPWHCEVFLPAAKRKFTIHHFQRLLSKSSTSSMNVKRLRALCVELYKTINKLNPNFKDLFILRFTNRPIREKYKMNIIISEFNQVTYGKKSLNLKCLMSTKRSHILKKTCSFQLQV